MTSDKAAAN